MPASFSRSTKRPPDTSITAMAGIDAGDAADAGEREGAFFDELRLAVLGDMFGDDDDLPGAVHEVHGAADSRHALGADAPVGEVAVLRHLVSAEDRDVEMAAAHHGEAVGMVEEGGAGFQRDGLLAGIDQVPVFLHRRVVPRRNRGCRSRCGRSPRGPRLVAGDHFRKADAEIDIGAIRDVLRRAPGDLRVGEFDVFAGIDVACHGAHA
jgi:hypothetical protein